MSFATQICSGMEYLARQNCVHRNLRLENVYLTNLRDVVITNFALARTTDDVCYKQKRDLTSDSFLVYPPEVSENRVA